MMVQKHVLMLLMAFLLVAMTSAQMIDDLKYVFSC